MYRQWEKLAASEAVTASVEYDHDLKYTTGQLAALMLVFEGSTVSGAFAGGGNWRLIDYLTNIQILLNSNPNGGALPARIAQAIMGYRLGQRPVSAWRTYATNTQRDHILWLFGRDIWDKTRYLDLSRYNSCHVHVVNNFTSSLFTGVTCTIWGLWLRENTVATQGFIKRSLYREWVPVAGATDQNILPGDYPIAGIYVQGDPGLDGNGRVNTHPHNLLYPVRLSMLGRQSDIFNDNIAHLNYASNLIWGELPIEGGQVYISSGKEVNVGLAHVLSMTVGAGSKTGAAATVDPTVEGDENNPSQNFLSAQADVAYNFIARGTGYENVFPLYMDKTPDLSELLDPKTKGPITVDMTCRSGVTVTSANDRIALEQLVPV